MLFDVPLIPDTEYVDALIKRKSRLAAVHFSLHSAVIGDGRPSTGLLAPARLAELLSRLRGPRKYALLNSRFQSPERYFDAEVLDTLAGTLALLQENANLDGVVYADHYLLQALSDRHPKLCAELEAVPSINSMLDSPLKISQRLDYIGVTAFRPPQKIILDRSLNRDLEGLRTASQAVRRCLPEARVELLANEGCLSDCPFKPTHDALIAHAHTACGTMKTFDANMRLGCGRYLATDPSRIFQSPFIRPEDVGAYAEHVDIIKLCGRTLGPEAMLRVIDAYLTGGYVGNLLDLLDTMECLSDTMIIRNEDLPEDFWQKVTSCDKACATCSYCSALAASRVSRRPHFSVSP